MEPEYLLDSNVVIGFLAGHIPAPGMAAVSRMVERQARIAVIAATALCEGCTLVTRNIADFRHIPNLSLLDPWDLPITNA
jgi:predicted nucleic acid-binding protein